MRGEEGAAYLEDWIASLVPHAYLLHGSAQLASELVDPVASLDWSVN